MKLVGLECPFCNGHLDIPEGRTSCFCSYCGKQILLDDETIKIKIEKTERYVDAARMRELDMLEAEKKRIAEEQEKADARLQAKLKEQQAKERKRKKIGFLIGGVFLGLCLLFGILFGCIARFGQIYNTDVIVPFSLIIGLISFIYPIVFWPTESTSMGKKILLWFLKMYLIMAVSIILFVIPLQTIGGSTVNDYTPELDYENINSTFSTESTLDSIGKVKYKVPTAWSKEEKNDLIQYTISEKAIIQCRTRYSTYSTPTNQIEETNKWLESWDETYDLSLSYMQYNGHEVGVVSGEYYSNGNKFQFISYILPSDGKNTFIEVIVLNPSAITDTIVNDCEAVIASVVFP